MLWLFATLFSGCTTQENRPEPVSNESARSMHLAHVEFKADLPESSRPDGMIPHQIPVSGPWRYTGQTRGGMHTYQAELPFRSRALFFNSPQTGLAMKRSQGEDVVPYDRFGKHKDWRWSHDRRRLLMYSPQKNGAPKDGEFFIEFETAEKREAALNWNPKATSLLAQDFAHQEVAEGWDMRRGLLVPAPGSLTWSSIEVPPSAELTFQAGIVLPEIIDGASNGAKLIIEVQAGEESKVVFSQDLTKKITPMRLDLSEFSGQTVTLIAKSEPNGDPLYDYVFLGDPILSSRKENPQTVLMVFIDTLRPDHLGLFGYDRDTTAALTHLDGTAAIFENARSIAPWTLPSARAVITGQQPEAYETAQTLPGILAKEGWATAFIAGNVYLGANFDMHKDWALHRIGLWPSAEEVTDDALQWLDENEGRDALLQVHFMDPHLPYVEPPSYRNKYNCGPGVRNLRNEFHLSDVRKARIRPNDTEAIDFIKCRYDNNIRYATDQIQRMVDRLDDNDVLVIYADHGEEFWDHKGFEHGHTLKEELLRVPIIIRGPKIKQGRVQEPVSLIDLTPTILDMVGVVPEDSHIAGTSLVPLTQGDAKAKSFFTSREHSVGRPLYGVERWGVIHEGKKWTTHDGREAVYDVIKDPKETKNLTRNKFNKARPFHQKFEDGLNIGKTKDDVKLTAGLGYRLLNTRAKGGRPGELVATCTVPGGVESVRVGNDYLNRSEATAEISGERSETLTVTWAAGRSGMREVFFLPMNRNYEEVTHNIVCQVTDGGGPPLELVARKNLPSAPGNIRATLGQVKMNGRDVALTWAVSPFGDLTMNTGGGDEASLAGLGYVETESTTIKLEHDGWTQLRSKCPTVEQIPLKASDRVATFDELAAGNNCWVYFEGTPAGKVEIQVGKPWTCSVVDGQPSCVADETK